MGKVKLLLDVIEDIRSLADSLEAVADAMSRSDPPDPKAEEPKAPAPKAVEETPAPDWRRGCSSSNGEPRRQRVLRVSQVASGSSSASFCKAG